MEKAELSSDSSSSWPTLRNNPKTAKPFSSPVMELFNFYVIIINKLLDDSPELSASAKDLYLES
jgi:hypothetical protein